MTRSLVDLVMNIGVYELVFFCAEHIDEEISRIIDGWLICVLAN